MNINAQYAAGIDSGSASTDAVILDRSGKICGWAIVPTGAGAATGARQALEQALTMALPKATWVPRYTPATGASSWAMTAQP